MTIPIEKVPRKVFLLDEDVQSLFDKLEIIETKVETIETKVEAIDMTLQDHSLRLDEIGIFMTNTDGKLDLILARLPER